MGITGILSDIRAAQVDGWEVMFDSIMHARSAQIEGGYYPNRRSSAQEGTERFVSALTRI